MNAPEVMTTIPARPCNPGELLDCISELLDDIGDTTTPDVNGNPLARRLVHAYAALQALRDGLPQPEPLPTAPETGLATLVEVGLDLAIKSSQVELLAWHPADTDLPDVEERVLICVEVDDSVLPVDYETGWDDGWWDGDVWRLCESGGVVDGLVTWWAQPKGPRK